LKLQVIAEKTAKNIRRTR